MLFGHCHGPVWVIDDFTPCFEDSYLRTLIPLTLCALSLLHLVYHGLLRTYRSRRHRDYSILEGTSKPANRYSDADPNEDDGVEEDHVEIDDAASAIDNEFLRNAELSLHPTVSQVNRTSLVEADKPRGELFLVSLECLLVVVAFGIHVALSLRHFAHGSNSHVAAGAGVAIWAYIFVLVSIRFICTYWKRPSFPKVWYHTAWLYGLFWCFSLLVFRSSLIHPRSKFETDAIIISFSINTVLMFIAMSTRRGNKPINIEYEGDIPPAREVTASILSCLTFSWVDAIVLGGYRKTLEMADVWNLPLRDKSAVVLANYRQVKKTSSLAWHLLKHFKKELIAQATWAGFSGFLTFVPTLLLREILRYIEDPNLIPRNTAWFFVILLFVSGCATAVSDGQALWIGRHVCVRLRAVIIGEIYAKALKRRIGTAGGEKVLGIEAAKGQSAKPSAFRRMLQQLGFKDNKRQGHDAQNQATADSKSKKDSAADDGQVTSGTIINLMAVDSFKISEICAYLHFLWASTPVQLVVSVVLLYQTLGFSSIAGIGMMLLLFPVNMFISYSFARMQKKILAATDARIHTTNEVLTNIRIIKFFAWEQRFIADIDEKRKLELKHLRTRYILWASAATIWGGAPVLITFLSFAIYTLVEKKDLVPSVAFTALSLFQILRVPLDQLADMVAHVQEAKVSVDRVEEFLNEEDTQKYSQLRHKEVDPSAPTIGFVNGTFSWGSGKEEEEEATEQQNGGTPTELIAFRLLDLNLKFQPGELNIIAGPTGCGKTSMLMALLGEMTLIEGKVYLPGARSREELRPDPQTGLTDSVAYCAQQAWLVNGTIKDNITFASPWDAERYQQVVKACALQKDFQILDAGDQTLVGEKGVTLSGGQKQRVSLARALYCRARHVLLDDILSAVDSHTAKWIFEEALMGPLMQNRTCILVTHNVALCLPRCQYAVVLDNGKVTVEGSPENVITSGKLHQDLTKSLPASRAPSRPVSASASQENLSGSKPKSTDVTLDGDIEMNGGVNGNGATDKHATPAAGPAKAVFTPSTQALGEGKAEGSVKLSLIFMYLRAMGGWKFWILAALLFSGQQVSNVSTNVWIRQWANAYITKEYSSSTHSPVTSPALAVQLHSFGNSFNCLDGTHCSLNYFPGFHTISNHTRMHHNEVDAGYYLGVFAILGFAFMLISFLREGILFAGSLSASKKLHDRLILAVCRAKFRFFDSTPLGQIMNRFSKDIENVDQETAPVAVGALHCLATIFTIVALISIIIPGFLIAGVFITILYCLIGWFYINSSRDLKRMESVQRSPLYQQFGETLTGMTTIRAYGDERRFIRDNLKQVNNHSRPFLYLWSTNRWLAFRVDVAGALVSFFSGVFVVLSVGRIDAGAAGLAMTYAVSFTENVLWFVRLYAANEQNMNSVERIKEYLDVDQEAEPIVPENRPSGDWPSQGVVELRNYSTRYRKDLDLVLNDVSFSIAPCEKIGVIGRTGAGKSSLALALFRALEAETGQIFIDGIDISTIGLQDLRENIVMVPQDPTLFSGTIRSNLDPFGLFTDEEIFETLRRVQLIGANTPKRPLTPASGVNDLPKFKINGHFAQAVESETVTAALASPVSAKAENKNIFLDLKSTVTESGNNLSQGQRQLLCLARALLKGPKVLLMDEATASIDYATDAKVQETIRELKNNTIITIAHRLKTIVDYDRVVVMERGRVVEIGRPWDLLRQDDGAVLGEGGRRWFREMCENSGDLESLEIEAKKSHDQRLHLNVE